MKKQTLYILLIIIGSLLYSCQKEIDFDEKLIAPKLVINGFVMQDSLIKLHVSTSKSIPGVSQSYKWLDDAEVKLFVDGEEKELLEPVAIEYDEEDDNYYSGWYSDDTRPKSIYVSQTIAEPGKTYKVEVSHADYEKAWAETRLPDPVKIISVDTTFVTEEQYDWNDNRLIFKIKFKDPPNKDNFYRIGFNGKMGHWFPENWEHPNDSVGMIEIQGLDYIRTDDPLITGGDDANDFLFGSPYNRYSVFNDELIDGKDYVLEMSTYLRNYGFSDGNFPAHPAEFIDITISLFSISRDAYLYLRSVDSHQYYDGDLFSEPVQVYSNVENGVGIFAGMSSFSKQFMIGEYPVEGFEYQEYY